MRDVKDRETWLLPGARKDAQSVTADWQPVGRALIDGVIVREARSVPKRHGLLTELFRADWYDGPAPVGQIFIAHLRPGAVSAWHAHAEAVDRLTVIAGAVTVVLFDTREGSPTHGRVNEFHLAPERPTTIVVPPRVWHGVQATAETTSILANLPDRAYQYADPDHWRVAPDAPEIPYRFAALPGQRDAI